MRRSIGPRVASRVAAPLIDIPAARAPAAALLLSLVLGTAWASPSVPWTPDAATRHRIELLVDEAGLDLPVSHWPLPRDAVERALDALPAALPDALDDARAQVLRSLHAQDASRLTLTLRNRAEALPAFGDDATPGSSLAVRSRAWSTDHVAIQFGGRLDPADGHGGQLRFDESAVATEVVGLQLQGFAHRNWWGPGWQSSTILSNNSPAFAGVGFQRASASSSPSPLLSWLGPWNFEFFVAQAEDPVHAYFIGNRLTFKPWSHLEIGLTRSAQWGGSGHPHSIKSFVKMLAGIGVNGNTPSEVAADPANEMSGYDLRLRCFGGVRCAAYTQLIGEDATHGWPGRFLGLYGIESWSADGTQRWFGEFAETLCGGFREHNPARPCAYRNHGYPEGYTNARRWIGAAIGPDSRVLTLGWMDAMRGTTLRLHRGRIASRVGSFSPLPDDPQTGGRLLGVAARQDLRWAGADFTAELDWMRINAADGPRSDARIGLQWRTSLDAPTREGAGMLGSALSGASGSRWSPWLVGTGLVAGAALLDRPVDDYVRTHGHNASARGLRDVGNVLPMVGFGLAGTSWLMKRGSTEGDVGFSAIAAGLTAVTVTEATKFVVDRARPGAELGPASFGDIHNRRESSFPSFHTALAWAVATPYAKHYDAPWLYGVAALTNTARLLGRRHWLSDTVAGAVLGYAIGDRFYRASGASRGDRLSPQLNIGFDSVSLTVPFE